MRPILLSLLFLTFPLHASAINRCESNGHISYSEQPCPDGKAQIVKEPPAPDNPEALRKEVSRQKIQATRLEKERLKQEAVQERQQQQVGRAAATKNKKCAGISLHTKWAQEDARKAKGKLVAKARQKARRAEEKYQLECGS